MRGAEDTQPASTASAPSVLTSARDEARRVAGQQGWGRQLASGLHPEPPPHPAAQTAAEGGPRVVDQDWWQWLLQARGHHSWKQPAPARPLGGTEGPLWGPPSESRRGIVSSTTVNMSKWKCKRTSIGFSSKYQESRRRTKPEQQKELTSLPLIPYPRAAEGQQKKFSQRSCGVPEWLGPAQEQTALQGGGGPQALAAIWQNQPRTGG